jgi:hypothetical protein
MWLFGRHRPQNQPHPQKKVGSAGDKQKIEYKGLIAAINKKMCYNAPNMASNFCGIERR